MNMSEWKTQFLKDDNWKAGWSLDEHTIRSTLLPGGGFNNEYTELGKLMNEIKYHNAKNKIKPLAKKIYDFMKKKMMVTPYLSGVVPTPPSKINREFQPVFDIAEELAKELKIPVLKDCLVKTKETPLMKGIADKEEKKKILSGAFKVIKNDLIKNKKILLFDDIYESGETLKEIARVLHKEGGVQNVYVLTVTKTRTKGVTSRENSSIRDKLRKLFQEIHKDKKLPTAQIILEWVKRCEQGENPKTIVNSYVLKK